MDQDVHIIHIESDVIVHVIDALNLVPKMKAADVVFLDIENQPVRWNYSIQINNGEMANVVETTMAMARALKVKMITMVATKDVAIERIGIDSSN